MRHVRQQALLCAAAALAVAGVVALPSVDTRRPVTRVASSGGHHDNDTAPELTATSTATSASSTTAGASGAPTTITTPPSPPVDQKLTYFSLPTEDATPYDIATGPDGNLWFVENRGITSKVGRITPAGEVTESVVPGDYVQANSIARGPDEAMWFTVINGSFVGRVDMAGTVTTFPLPGIGARDITAGPDGALWVTLDRATEEGWAVVRMTTDGATTVVDMPGWTPHGLASGPDGAIWVAGYRGAIYRITTSGEVSTLLPLWPAGSARGITTGPDGALWFAWSSSSASDGNGWLGRVTTAGEFSRFPVAPGYPEHITAGPDGNLWLALDNAGAIAQVTTSGVVTIFEVPDPGDLTVGPDGNIWWVSPRSDIVGRLRL